MKIFGEMLARFKNSSYICIEIRKQMSNNLKYYDYDYHIRFIRSRLRRRSYRPLFRVSYSLVHLGNDNDNALN